MKAREKSADSTQQQNGPNHLMDCLHLYHMIRLENFDNCAKCGEGRCSKFQAYPDALDHANQKAVNRICMNCGCHCCYHTYKWFKIISYRMYAEMPGLYDNLGDQKHRVTIKPWDLASIEYAGMTENRQKNSDNNSYNNNMANGHKKKSAHRSTDENQNKSHNNSDYNNNNNNINAPLATNSSGHNNNFSPPRSNSLNAAGNFMKNNFDNYSNNSSNDYSSESKNSALSSPSSSYMNGSNNNSLMTTPIFFSMPASPFSSPATSPPLNLPQNNNNNNYSGYSGLNNIMYGHNMPAIMNTPTKFTNGFQSSESISSASSSSAETSKKGNLSPSSLTPAVRKSSEAEINGDEPALKKQKVAQTTVEFTKMENWNKKSIPAEKEKIVANTSPFVQCKIVRKITKNQIMWDNVTNSLVKEYEKKIEDKKVKLAEVSQSSRWFWMNECKVYFERENNGQLIGAIQLTAPRPKEENRFLREYGPDEFLIVNIKRDLAVLPNSPPPRKDDWTRKKTIIRELFDAGIWVGTVHYQFCFASASHMRERKAVFHTNPNELRAKLGDFSEIRNPTKYLARLGQPWSSSTASIELKPDQVRIEPDLVSESGKEFTDGCGEIAPDLIKAICSMEAFQHLKHEPSAFQVRWGPCKGVLVVNPNLPPGTVMFRKSMQKYKIHNPSLQQRQLEIIRPAKRSSSTLNREFIPLLHALGVPENVFRDLIMKQIARIRTIGENPEYVRISFDEDTPFYMDKLKIFQTSKVSTNDPYFAGLIQRAKQTALQDLKRLKVEVERSCRLTGVYDTSGKLEEDQCYVTYRHGNESIQHTCPVVVMKNPTVHLGDVRVLNAVVCPELSHLEDVIVFPVKGKRPVADTIGGGDLDGDLYWVSAYPEFVKYIKTEPPADYPAPVSEAIQPGVDIAEKAKDAYIQQTLLGVSLGAISNKLYTLADHFEDGPRNKHCLDLARLHAKKVDSAKTGEIIFLSKDLNRVTSEIGSAKFLETKIGKIIETKGIVGKLYKMIEEEIKQIELPQIHFNYMDLDLLVNGREKYKKEARKLFKLYNQKSSLIMKKNDINVDEAQRKIKFQLLDEEFKKLFWEGLDNSHDEAYKKASAWYEVCYGDKSTKARAFPWVNIDVLMRIKNDRLVMAKTSRMAMSIPK